MNKLRISNKGLELIKSFEGCVLHSYADIGGVLTIGYGHTGSDVKKNQTITQERAIELLKQDIHGFEITVNEYVKVKLNQNQFDALVSFAYNVGSGAFIVSTLLKKLNNGDYKGASLEFDRWVHVKGTVVRGLQNRRDAEQKLFNTPIPVAPKHTGPIYYTVVKGDNLTKIGQKYGKTVAWLKATNNIKNENLIRIGERLRVN